MKKKMEVMSFKIEEDLAKKIKKMPNRSEFIRQSIISSMTGTCPLCNGQGTLNEEQRTHWNDFLKGHDVINCEHCHGIEIKCHPAHKKLKRTKI